MTSNEVMALLKDLEIGADLLDCGNGTNLGEIEEKVNLLLGYSLNFEECLGLLSFTSKPFVHFQICKLLKNIVLQNFQSNVEYVFHSLSHFIKNMPEIPYYVETALIEVLCLVYKIFLASPLWSEHSLDICAIVEEFISSSAFFMRKRGFLLLRAVVSEMLNDSLDFKIGITCEKQMSIKISFQNKNMRRFIAMCASSLEYYSQHEDAQWMNLIPEIVSAMCDLFSWPFLVKNSMASLPSWHEAISQLNLPEVLFGVLSKVRLINPNLTVEIFQFVTQLASTKVKVTDGLTPKIMIFVLSCLSMPNIKENEILGVSSIIHSMTECSSLDIFLLEKPLLLKFVSVFSEMTCYLCQFSSDQDRVTGEALDNLLQSWFVLAKNTTLQDKDVLNEIKSSAEKVFQFYLKSHISAPEGDRRENDIMKENQVEYNNEVEDAKDEVSFSDHLVIVGMLGRFSIEENLAIILKCLFSKTDKLKECFLYESELYITNIYEDIHWILLLLTELMTDQDDVYNMIPIELIHFSHSRPITNQDLFANTSNEFVSITQWIGVFCNIEVEAQRLGFMGRFSPLLEASFLGFLTRFSSSYIMFNQDMYSELSMCIDALFGCDSEYAPCMVQQLLEKIHFNLKVWGAEEEVVEKTLNLFQVLSSDKEKNKVCLSSSTFWTIVKESLTNQSMTKSNKIKLLRNIFSILPQSDPNVHIDMEKVLHLLEVRLKEITRQIKKSDLSGSLSGLRINLSDCFDWLAAVVSSTKIVNCKHIFECYVRCWTDIFLILDLYHGYDQIFEESFSIYLEASQFLIPYLQEIQASEVLQLFTTLIDIYAKYYGGSLAHQNFDITYLIEKAFKHFINIDTEKDSKYNSLLTNTLSSIIQLLDPSMFELPEGATLFSSLMSATAERCVEAFLPLEERHCKKLIILIEHILLGRYNSDVIEYCLSFIKLLAEGLTQSQMQLSCFHLLGYRLLEIVFQITLCENTNTETYVHTAPSLCVLVVLFPQVYQRLTLEIAGKSSHGQIIIEKLNSLLDVLHALRGSGIEKNRIMQLQTLRKLVYEIRQFVRM